MRVVRASVLLACALALACSDDAPAPASEPAPPSASSSTGSDEAAPERDPVEAVPDCDALETRASAIVEDALLMPMLCPGASLDHSRLRELVLSVGSAAEAATLVAMLDGEPELQGLLRLASLDHASQPLPNELPDPATALLTPVDDRILAAVELAHAQLRRTELDEATRTRAHAFLARVHLQALQTLGLPAGRPLPPFARLLAGPALLHARSFCRFYWQRRIAGLERTFAETEVDLLALTLDLDDTPHFGDPGLLAVERHRARLYLQREGPTRRIADRAKRNPQTQALGTELLLPLAQELDRLIDLGFIALALDQAMAAGAAANGYGLDPVIAVATEDLRQRDLREYERRLAARVELARRKTPSSRHGTLRPLEPELPVEWPAASELAARSLDWLRVAHGRGPDFARRHALARAIRPLRARPDAVVELLTRDDPAVLARHAELFALLDASDAGELARLRLRVEAQQPSGVSAQARDARMRRRFALATRDALSHPR